MKTVKAPSPYADTLALIDAIATPGGILIAVMIAAIVCAAICGFFESRN